MNRVIWPDISHKMKSYSLCKLARQEIISYRPVKTNHLQLSYYLPTFKWADCVEHNPHCLAFFSSFTLTVYFYWITPLWLLFQRILPNHFSKITKSVIITNLSIFLTKKNTRFFCLQKGILSSLFLLLYVHPNYPFPQEGSYYSFIITIIKLWDTPAHLRLHSPLHLSLKESISLPSPLWP